MLCLVLSIASIQSYGQTGCDCPAVSTCVACAGGLKYLLMDYTGGGIIISVSASDNGGALTASLLTGTITINSRVAGQPFDGNVTVSVTYLSIPLNLVDSEVINTSCTPPVYVGQQFGNFTMLNGSSMAGALCCAPVDTDHTPPVFNTACPSNIQLFPAPGTCAATATWTPPTATDNCGTTVNLSSTHNPGATFPLGITAVTYTAKDDYDNTSTCSFNVEVIDNINPQISNCPSNILVSSGVSTCDAVVTWTQPTASDNCTVTSFSPNHAPGSTFPVGITTVTYTAKDAANNTVTCNFTVEVTDNTAPVINNCPSTISVSSSSLSCDAIVSWTSPTASDNCAVSSFIPDHASGSAFPIGITTVTYTAKDAANNTTSCSFTVEVTDNTAPVISNCPANISVSSSSSSCDVVVNWTAPTASDNCSVNTFTSNHNPGETFPIGITTVTYTAKDIANNTTLCSFTVEVTDNTAPVISNCPTTISVSSSSSSCDAVVNWTAPTASDNCSVNTFTSNHNPGETFPVGITTITYTAKDVANNTTTCNFTVEVTDNTAPVISNCPTTISVSSSSSSCDAVVNWTAPTATDNCWVNTFTSNHNPGETFPVGITTVTYTTKDDANNTTTCSFTVEVTDNTAPVISNCPANLSVSSGTSSCDATVNWTAPTAADNCSVNTFTSDHNSGDAFPVGITTVTYTAKDAANNTTTCSFTVEVFDTTLPVIANCPSNILISTSVSTCDAIAIWTVPTASDNCTVNSFTSTHNSGDPFPIGITTVTYTAKDVANNTTTCNFTVQVTDNTSPILSNCPATISVPVGSPSSCNAIVNWTAPTASDNCSVTSFTSDHNPGETFGLGITTVTYTAKDAANNITTCSFTVEVLDNVAPTITCPSNFNVTANSGCSYMLIDYTTLATTSDNCDTNVTVTQSPVAGTILNGAGTTQVITLTATDDTGNSSNCTFTITVIDNAAPTITCPADFNVVTGVGCSYTLLDYTAMASAADNCDTNVAITQSPVAGTILNGVETTQLITFTATDDSGNSSNCSVTITLIDNIAPNITCPSDFNVPTGPGCSYTLADLTSMASASDQCDTNVTITQSPTAGTILNGVGTTQLITFTATDDSGNTSNCSVTITLTDNTAPTITCPGNFDVTNDVSCAFVLPDYTGIASAADNCDTNVTITQSPASGTLLSGAGTTQMITLTATDDTGNSSNCTFAITLKDNIAPQIISCPSNILVNISSSSCDTVVTWTAPTASDNCTIDTFTSNYNSGDTFVPGITTVTYTAKDPSGNTTTCSFTVEVTDNIAPQITSCPTNISVPAGSSSCNAIVNWIAPTATDNCSIASFVADHNSVTAFAIGITTVTYTAKDVAGNTTTCSFTVEVTDNLAPLISNCPANINISTRNSCDAILTWSAPIATDNCSILSFVSTHNSGAAFPIGTTTVTYTATDINGNSSDCSFDIIVLDDTAPVISNCPANISLNANTGCNAIANWTVPTATDNCGIPALSSTHNPGTSFPMGVTTVTYTAEDAEGNITTCTFTVEVRDTIAPVINGCITNDIVVSLTGTSCATTATWTSPTATDDCSSVTLTNNHNPGESFDVGITQVIYTATDAAGNISTCSFNVIVKDETAPVITCLPNITASTGNSCDATVNWNSPLVTDCSIVTLTSTPASGSMFALGTTDVTYTATDANGNSSICTFKVIVEDKTKPIFSNCLTEINVVTDASCQAIVNWNAPKATDNCGAITVTSTHTSGSLFNVGTTLVTYTAIDNAGNSSLCRFNVIVIDGNVPEISGCPSNIEMKAGESGQVSVIWTEPTASVSCGTIEMVSSHSPGELFPVGTTEVEYIATTKNGNAISCKFMVNVSYEEIAFDVNKLITPNGDGMNDVWQIQNIESFKDNSITVIDRWGGVIYSASGYNNESVSWNGTNTKGVNAPTGTYFYTISVRFRDKQVDKKGFIELVR